MRYSAFSIFKEAISGHKGWKPAWRRAEPRPKYDVVIIGGGGHGLATAHYISKVYGITNVAVLEKGWVGGGNVGRKGARAPCTDWYLSSHIGAHGSGGNDGS